MYSLIRKLHLYTAMILATFVVMYFVSGYVLAHGAWFGRSQAGLTTRTVGWVVGPGAPTEDEAAFAEELQRKCDVRGKRGRLQRQNDGRWKLTVFRPGTHTEILLEADFKSAQVSEARHGWQRTLIGFHRLHGYGGGRLYDVWAVVYDLASFSMILFAVSGVWLWWKLIPERRLGWTLLAGSFLFTLGMGLYFFLNP